MSQGNQDEVDEKVEVIMPDITGNTIEEAEKILKENGIEIKINNDTEELDKKNTTVTKQIPEGGIKVYQGSCAYIEY